MPRLFAPATAALALSLSVLTAAGPALANNAEKKKGGGETFLQLAPSAAMVVRPDGRRGVVTVEAGLDVKDPDLHARADALRPRLRDAYVTAIQAHVQGIGAGAPPNADKLSAQLQQQTDRVLGKPGAKLLLGSIILN